MIDGIKLLLSKFYQDLQASFATGFLHAPLLINHCYTSPSLCSAECVETEDWWPDRLHCAKINSYDTGIEEHMYIFCFVMENVNLGR